MSLKSYPEYKESHQKWLGKVPSHWEVRPSKSVFALRNESEKPGDVHLTPSQTLGVLPQSEYTKITGNKVVLALAGTTMKHVEINDFVIHLRSFQGGIEWSGYQGKVSPAYTVLKPKDGAVPGFFQYCLKSRGYIETIASLTDQLRDGQSMRYYDFGKTPLPLPSPSEQHEIVAFLDRETAEIDAFISDQEELIELLSERRTATITRAVAKGLDPNAPMKDSGVEWLGEIPADWSITKLSWAARCSSGSSLSNEKFDAVPSDDLSIPVIGGNGVTGYTNMSNIDSSRIVIGRVGALCGNVHFVQSPAWITDNALRLIIDESFFNPIYLTHLLRARNLNNLADKTAQPLITGSLVASQRIPCPPLNVQHLIANHISQEIFEFDAAIADAREAITLSKERRAAVISAAVTGKIDVRGLVDPATSIVEGASVGAA